MNKRFSLMTLSETQQKTVKGGMCGCVCAWANCGGSSTKNNGHANFLSDAWSTDDGPRNSN
jgi:hypothetical protein